MTPARHAAATSQSETRKSRTYRRAAQLLGTLLLCILLGIPAKAGQLGANASLMSDYLSASDTNAKGTDGYRFIRRQMAKKSIRDAQAVGFKFLRVGVTGYRPIDFADPVNDLAIWQNNPDRFWAAADEMFDDLDQAGIQIVPTLAWNILQFPALGGDDLATFLRDPGSRSRALLRQLVTDFVSRYRSRQTILFYELSNEWNLDADIDLERTCRANKTKRCVWHDFSTDDLVEFSRWFVSLVKSLDPSRKVSSGFSLPRAAASHLRSGAGWISDSVEEFKEYLVYLNEPFDIVSVHIYPGEAGMFGASSDEPDRLISVALSAVKSVGKQLFVGEFGDSGITPFLRNFLHAIVDQHVDYAAIWVWEFYQTSTYETHNTDPSRFSIEPGYYDDLIALLGQTEQALGSKPEARISDRPVVVLTWPLPCAKVDRPTTLAAVASAGMHRVKAVEFFVNGKSLATAASPPFYAKFDPGGFGDSNIEIEARAVAASGLSAGFKTVVRVNDSQAFCQVPSN
jgi:Bacterial Ig domain